MKRIAIALVSLVAFVTAAWAAPPDAPKLVFKTGARPTPAHIIASAPRFTKSGKLGAPLQYAVVPKRLSMWGNDRYGCCVTSEECAAKIADNPNCFITEDTCLRWASQHGVLNGADLGSVLKMMEQDGITAEDGKNYKDGPAATVNFNDKIALEAAIYVGRVKIAVAADQIQNAVSQTRGRSGWTGINWRRDQSIDHCVGLFGYGPAKFLYEQLGQPLPAEVDPNTYGYLMFTWNSIGFVDRPSLLAITAEAWVRQPTTAGYPKPPEPTPAPQPVPTPTPTPTPSHGSEILLFVVCGFVLAMTIGGILLTRRAMAAK